MAKPPLARSVEWEWFLRWSLSFLSDCFLSISFKSLFVARLLLISETQKWWHTCGLSFYFPEQRYHGRLWCSFRFFGFISCWVQICHLIRRDNNAVREWVRQSRGGQLDHDDRRALMMCYLECMSNNQCTPLPTNLHVSMQCYFSKSKRKTIAILAYNFGEADRYCTTPNTNSYMVHF